MLDRLACPNLIWNDFALRVPLESTQIYGAASEQKFEFKQPYFFAPFAKLGTKELPEQYINSADLNYLDETVKLETSNTFSQIVGPFPVSPLSKYRVLCLFYVLLWINA